MTYRLAAVLSLWVAALWPTYSSAAPDKFDHAEVARSALAEFIRPGYQRLGKAIDGLREPIAQLCEDPSRKHLAAARRAFASAVTAWGRVEILTFGPVRQANRRERIFFWPDRSGIGARQIRKILATRPPRAVRPETLAGMSVALQGLTALEQALYGAGASDLISAAPYIYRCRYAFGIARNLSRITEQINSGWAPGGPFAKLWLQPGVENPVYFEASETTHELVKMLDQGLETVRDERIAPALGLASKRRVMRPVLWRSKLSMRLIHANVQGLRDLLFASGLSQAAIRSAGDRRDEVSAALRGIRNEFRLLLRMTGKLAREPDPFARPDIRRQLIPVGFPLKNVRTNAVALLKRAAGLSVGFNASDGD